jgi:aryl-alcohol dehydrogenase-like predicted oxidoreductase
MTLPATTAPGDTGLEITRIGFGAWAIGGGWQFGWGPQQDIAWTLRNPAVDGAIVGVRNPAQAGQLLPAVNLRLTDADVAEVEE